MSPPNLLPYLLLLSLLSSTMAWEWPPNTPAPIDYCYPDQVHISLGDAYYNSQYNFTGGNEPNSTVMIIWQTQAKCDNFYVIVHQIGHEFVLNVTSEDIWIELLDEEVEADMNKIGSDGRYVTYSHTAMISNLQPGVKYIYEIFQTNGSSTAGPFIFNLPAISVEEQTKPIKFVVYGDVDTAGNNITYNALKNLQDKDAEAVAFQMFLGDIGYDIFSENGKRGEYCYNGWQSLHASWPFMVTPGNHERYKNYTFLNIRTRMPLYNKTKNHYYSFNVGQMHIIALNYYFYNVEPEELREQMFEWMEADLKAANASRNERPWIIVTTHQPIYCSLNDPDDQHLKRCYNFYERYTRFDEIYYKYRVDLVLQGHAHIWERMTPLYKNQTQDYQTWAKDSQKNYIINPEAPVYTLESATGNSYYMGHPGDLESYTMNIDSTLSYTTVTLVNGSSIKYEHFDSNTGKLMDYFYLNKGEEYQAFDLVPVILNNKGNNNNNRGNGDNEPAIDIKVEGKTNSVYWIIFGAFISVGLIAGFFIWRRSKKEYAKFPREIGANVIQQLHAHGGNSSTGEIGVDIQQDAI